MSQPRIILVGSSEQSREVLARRLDAQGYTVEIAEDPVTGADLALSSPPAAVIADLWMPAISGIQLCRLLRTEPATADVPVILRGDNDDPRSRFWAERAGAVGYVRKGRMGELVRMLSKAVARQDASDGFFMQLSGGDIDIRDRIARYLDAALFDSVVAAEVRSLATCGSFDRLFDLLSQFLCQVIRYRWLALWSTSSPHFALHHHPADVDAAERQAREALGLPADTASVCIVDEDACPEHEGETVASSAVLFGGTEVARLALSSANTVDTDTSQLIALVARELGGPIRIAALMHEQQRLAYIDALTGLKNRRSFQESAQNELARSTRYDLPLTIGLLDVDHFKSVNDRYGHAAGDQVLSSIGRLLEREFRTPDVVARWGGEEFVALLPNTGVAGAKVAFERIRRAIEDLAISHEGTSLRVSVSIGISEFRKNESLDSLLERADRAMYVAKVGGRNRVVSAEEEPDETPASGLEVSACAQ